MSDDLIVRLRKPGAHSAVRHEAASAIASRDALIAEAQALLAKFECECCHRCERMPWLDNATCSHARVRPFLARIDALLEAEKP